MGCKIGIAEDLMVALSKDFQGRAQSTGPTYFYLFGLLGLVLFALACLESQAQEAFPISDRALELVPGENPGDILPYLHEMQAPESIGLGEVIKSSGGFEISQGEWVNPGMTHSVTWLRLPLTNSTGEDGTWVFSFDRVLLSKAGLYLVRQDEVENLLESKQEAFVASYEEFGTLAGKVHVPAKTAVDLYIMYRGAVWSGLQPVLLTEKDFRRSITQNLVFFIFLLGGIVTLLVFGSVSFLFMGRWIVIYYALAQISFFVFYAHMAGFTTVYLWPENAQSFRSFSVVALAAYVAAMGQLARVFFRTDDITPWVDRVILASVSLALFSMVFGPINARFEWVEYYIPVGLFLIASTVTWVLLPALAVYATLKWQKNYWPLIVAWGSMGSFILTAQLVWVGVISAFPLGKDAYGVVVYVEATFLALAIALRIRVLRNEKFQIEIDLNDSLQTQLASSERARHLAEERELAFQDLAEKGHLLLSAGHDARQMISALRHYATGIRRTTKSEKVEEASHKIDEITTRLNEILTTTIEGSRTGGLMDTLVAFDDVDPCKLFETLYLIHSPGAAERQTELNIRALSGTVVSDRVLIGRILGNLLSNAVKHSEQGKILLGYRRGRGGHRFQVWNEGQGLKPEELEILLSDATRSQKMQNEKSGQGSGLSIARTLAARLGGEIRACSKSGQGIVFELSLPEAESHKSFEANTFVHDKDPATKQLVDQIAITAGHEAASIVLIDEHVEGPQSGIKRAERERAASPEAKIVFLSFDRSVEARRSFAAHSDLIVYKPLTTEKLLKALSSCKKPVISRVNLGT